MKTAGVSAASFFGWHETCNSTVKKEVHQMDYVEICVFFHVLILTFLILYCCRGLSEAVKLLHFLSWSLFLNKRDCVLRGKNV